MKKHVNRKTAIITIVAGALFLLLMWFVLSLWYIVDNEIAQFKNIELYNADANARTETVNKLIQEAENEQCSPFPVYSDDKTIYLVNVNCLKVADNGTDTTTNQMIEEAPAQ